MEQLVMGAINSAPLNNDINNIKYLTFDFIIKYIKI